jgi:hypothetical protein
VVAAILAVSASASADSGRALIEIGRLSNGAATGVDPATLVSGLTRNDGAGGLFGVDAPMRGAINTFSYAPPANTAITGSTAQADLRASGWPALSTWTELHSTWGDWNVWGDPGNVAWSGTLSAGASPSVTASAAQMTFGAGAELPGWFLLDRLAVELADAADPSLSATPASGSLFGAPSTSGWYTDATVPVTVTASDRGLGVRRLLLRDTAGRVHRIPLPGLPASCATKDPSTSLYGGDTYTASVPCRTAATQYVVPVDLTAMGDGQYTLELGVMDA